MAVAAPTDVNTTPSEEHIDVRCSRKASVVHPQSLQSIICARCACQSSLKDVTRPPTCVITGESGDCVKPYHLVLPSMPSAVLRCLEHRWGIANGHIDPDTADNVVYLREDLHHALSTDGFALLPSLAVMDRMLDQILLSMKDHSDGAADLPHYTTVCPSDEYEYVFMPLRWSGVEPIMVNRSRREYASPENACPIPSDPSVPYFRATPPYGDPPFPKLRSRAHPFFVLANKMFTKSMVFYRIAKVMGHEYVEICRRMHHIMLIWGRPVGAPPCPLDEYEISCVSGDRRSLDEPPDSTCASGDILSLVVGAGKRRRSSSSSPHPRPMKLAKISSGDVYSGPASRMDDLHRGTRYWVRVGTWLTQTPLDELMEPEEPVDEILLDYKTERSIRPPTLDKWMSWKAAWVRKRDRENACAVVNQGKGLHT